MCSVAVCPLVARCCLSDEVLVLTLLIHTRTAIHSQTHCSCLVRLCIYSSSGWLLLRTGWLIEHGLTSPPTQYRLYGRRFLQVKRPNQRYQSNAQVPKPYVNLFYMCRDVSSIH